MRDSTTLPFKDLTATIPEYNRTTKLGNFDKTEVKKEYIVIHTMDGFLTGTDAHFSDPTKNASANYGLGLNGEIHQYVKEKHTAYHCGIYDGRNGNKVYNQNSLSIEHADNKNVWAERPAELYAASGALVKDICKAHGIPIDADHILGHNKVKPGKSCPANLDINRIIALARDDVVAPPPAQGGLNPNEDPVFNYLIQQFNSRLRAGTNEREFGTLEGMVRSLFEAADKYKSTFQPDAEGKPPVLISQNEFLNLSIKARNLDRIAEYFGEAEINRIDPNLGERLVGTIKLLSNGGQNPPDNTLPTNGLSQQDVSFVKKFINWLNRRPQA
jgi:hypothetical protein